MDVPLTLTTGSDLDMWNAATIEFQKQQGAEEICSIFTPEEAWGRTVSFKNPCDIYNLTFDAGAQAIIAASAGEPITLIQDLDMTSDGFEFFFGTFPSDTLLKLNGVRYNQIVDINRVLFTYVGPKGNDYVFQEGEIGITGYYPGSHALNLVAVAPHNTWQQSSPPTPEPTTGTLSLLALMALAARRRK